MVSTTIRGKGLRYDFKEGDAQWMNSKIYSQQSMSGTRR
jgi:hypothetical protein